MNLPILLNHGSPCVRSCNLDRSFGYPCFETDWRRKNYLLISHQSKDFDLFFLLLFICKEFGFNCQENRPGTRDWKYKPRSMRPIILWGNLLCCFIVWNRHKFPTENFLKPCFFLKNFLTSNFFSICTIGKWFFKKNIVFVHFQA